MSENNVILFRRRKMRKNPGDEDYEIVSFEDFCEKPAESKTTSKTDSLTLNDNINYRLCYETQKGYEANYERESSSNVETSLDGVKNVSYRRKSYSNFAPFGKLSGRSEKGSLFSGVIPKPKDDEPNASREQPRYERFSRHRNLCQRIWDNLPGMGPSIVGLALVCVLCVLVWWGVCGALGGAWGEEHYRKLWEKAHPDSTKKPLSPPMQFEKPIIKMPPVKMLSEGVPPEYRYHDHNNLSTKNKNASIETKKVNASLEIKKEPNKKNYAELSKEQKDEVCEGVPVTKRFHCGWVKQDECERRGCCYNYKYMIGAASCFYPPGYDSFKFVNMTENRYGIRVNYEHGRDSEYGNDWKTAVADLKYYSDEILQVKIYDPERRRFDPPFPKIPQAPGPTNPKYRVQVESGSVGFRVIRNSDNVTVINTLDAGALILSDKLIEISTLLPTNRVFGLGENRESFRKHLNYSIITMFNRDIAPTTEFNLYGTHPFYLAIEKDGKSHGLLFLNSNAVDVVMLPAPGLTFRAIGGIINLFFFVGPTPEAVLAQYTSVIGRPFMPPYWSLGFHLGKKRYDDAYNIRQARIANRDAGIPLDAQWSSMDYSYLLSYLSNPERIPASNARGLHMDYTWKKPNYTQELHSLGMHYVMGLDPFISGSEPNGSYPPYDRGLEMNVFIKNDSGLPFQGRIWNAYSTVYPDFTHPNATKYWHQIMLDFHQRIDYDGVWLNMNVPTNYLKGSKSGPCAPLDLPYRPHWTSNALHLNLKTLCMEARHHIGRHYDVHNLYGLYNAAVTYNALKEIRGKRPFIISQSSFPGLGRYAGHSSGNIHSTWEDMRASIKEILNFALFGIPMMGADICGFEGYTPPDLCRRWTQLGAFYPFARNNAASGNQDPASLGKEMIQHAKKWLRLRYTLLPYYYTLFWRAHIDGATVATPLVFLSPENEALDLIEDQFLIGRHVLISPIVIEGANSTLAYFPEPYKWYNILDGEYIASGEWASINEEEMVAVKGGAILPLQEPAPQGPVTTSNSRSRPLQLLAVPGGDYKAGGELYWDTGDSLNSYTERKYTHIEFTLKDDVLSSKVIWWGYGVPFINNITVLGLSRPVKSVTINGSPAKFEYKEYNHILYIQNLNLALDKPFKAQWIYSNIILKKINTDIPDMDLNKIEDCQGQDCKTND